MWCCSVTRTKALGALSEQECRRVIAALELAEQRDIPLEWCIVRRRRVSMGRYWEHGLGGGGLKKIVEFTQDGREINIVVAGINVGAQPYWNAEATMLMHTKGILVMTQSRRWCSPARGARLLRWCVGRGQLRYRRLRPGWTQRPGAGTAPNTTAARDILMSHYDHTYVVPGAHRAQRSPPTRSTVTSVGFPHVLAGSDFATVGIFSRYRQPGS